jgi:hypothetical protein
MPEALVLRADGSHSPNTLNLLLAHTPWRRLRGLLGYSALSANQGLWLKPCNAVHCCFMRFAIDVIYLDQEQRILKITTHLQPWRFSACWPATSTIEMAAGECRRLNIIPGEQIQCVD